LEIVTLDPHRAGHELLYHPGETNFRRAKVLIVNKMDSAPVAGVQQVMANIAAINPSATAVQARSNIKVDKPELINGKRVLVIPWRNGLRFGNDRRAKISRRGNRRSQAGRKGQFC